MQKRHLLKTSALRVRSRNLSLLLTLLISTFTNLYAQSIKVNGTVIDIQGRSLEGVSVNVKGTSNGTVTDSLGKFSITVPNSSVILEFSSVGFISKEEKV